MYFDGRITIQTTQLISKVGIDFTIVENKMPKFRKKPVVIEAVPFTPSTARAVLKDFIGSDWWHNPGEKQPAGFYGNGSGDGFTPIAMWIKTLEGLINASFGDWIIKGVKGEFYPCKPDIFEATYEAVVED